MSCVLMLQRGNSGDGCVLASTLCKHDLRKRDLFVLSCCCCSPFSPCSFQYGSLASRYLSSRTVSVGLLHKSGGISVVG